MWPDHQVDWRLTVRYHLQKDLSFATCSELGDSASPHREATRGRTVECFEGWRSYKNLVLRLLL